MLNINDFEFKQILLCFANEGDKICVNNDNVVVKNGNDIKCQATCYRLHIIYIIGQTTLTTALIDRAKKFGFIIILLTNSFRINDVIGFKRDANTLLHQKQYKYSSLDIAKHIIKNKATNQLYLLKKKRVKSQTNKEVIKKIESLIIKIPKTKDLYELLGMEGNISKIYFKDFFDGYNWTGRHPRIKDNYLNSLLDIGYTILFSYIEALLISYGFDIYYGVMHTQFYLRKSLVCDLVEPFRFLIDEQIKKSINLGQFKKEDFNIYNHRFELEWDKSKEYTAIFLKCILQYKEKIFLYIRNYYRAFMKNLNIKDYPVFEVYDGNN